MDQEAVISDDDARDLQKKKKTVRRAHRIGFAFTLTLGPLSMCTASSGFGCKKPPPADPPPPVIASATATVPPIALTDVPPAGGFADASANGTVGVGEANKTPYDQAHAYADNGQFWLARLVLEKKAMGPDGTKAEVELLASICHEQADEACVEQCSTKLGKKLKFDGGLPRQKLDAGEHKEPDSDVARARDYVLKRRYKEARDILEPKVVDGKASKEEIRLLRAVCKEQSDRMCVALCDAKLK